MGTRGPVPDAATRVGDRPHLYPTFSAFVERFPARSATGEPAASPNSTRQRRQRGTEGRVVTPTLPSASSPTPTSTKVRVQHAQPQTRRPGPRLGNLHESLPEVLRRRGRLIHQPFMPRISEGMTAPTSSLTGRSASRASNPNSRRPAARHPRQTQPLGCPRRSHSTAQPTPISVPQVHARAHESWFQGCKAWLTSNDRATTAVGRGLPVGPNARRAPTSTFSATSTWSRLPVPTPHGGRAHPSCRRPSRLRTIVIDALTEVLSHGHIVLTARLTPSTVPSRSGSVSPDGPRPRRPRTGNACRRPRGRCAHERERLRRPRRT